VHALLPVGFVVERFVFVLRPLAPQTAGAGVAVPYEARGGGPPLIAVGGVWLGSDGYARSGRAAEQRPSARLCFDFRVLQVLRVKKRHDDGTMMISIL